MVLTKNPSWQSKIELESDQNKRKVQILTMVQKLDPISSSAFEALRKFIFSSKEYFFKEWIYLLKTISDIK